MSADEPAKLKRLFSRIDVAVPRDEHEFDVLMERVDELLRDAQVPINGRAIQAWVGVASSLGLELSMFPKGLEQPREGRYTGDDLTLRIFGWFDRRYGDRQNVDFSPGRVVLLIRNDPWELVLPRTWGAVRFFASKTISSSNQEEDLQDRRPPQINILELITAFPEGLKNSLSNPEIRLILDIFNRTFLPMSLIQRCSNVHMFSKVRGDLDATVDHMMSSQPQFGLSRWASLQATEKALKSFLEEQGKKYDWSHKLSKLASQAEKAGLRSIDRDKLEKIQCPAGVRYGQAPVTLREAHEAHVASIEVVAMIAAQISC